MGKVASTIKSQSKLLTVSQVLSVLLLMLILSTELEFLYAKPIIELEKHAAPRGATYFYENHGKIEYFFVSEQYVIKRRALSLILIVIFSLYPQVTLLISNIKLGE